MESFGKQNIENEWNEEPSLGSLNLIVGSLKSFTQGMKRKLPEKTFGRKKQTLSLQMMDHMGAENGEDQLFHSHELRQAHDLSTSFPGIPKHGDGADHQGENGKAFSISERQTPFGIDTVDDGVHGELGSKLLEVIM